MVTLYGEVLRWGCCLWGKWPMVWVHWILLMVVIAMGNVLYPAGVCLVGAGCCFNHLRESVCLGEGTKTPVWPVSQRGLCKEWCSGGVFAMFPSLVQLAGSLNKSFSLGLGCHLGIPLACWCEHETNLTWLRSEFARGFWVQVAQEKRQWSVPLIRYEERVFIILCEEWLSPCWTVSLSTLLMVGCFRLDVYYVLQPEVHPYFKAGSCLKVEPDFSKFSLCPIAILPHRIPQSDAVWTPRDSCHAWEIALEGTRALCWLLWA